MTASEIHSTRFQGAGRPFSTAFGMVVVEDWWDRLSGKSWTVVSSNHAALDYALRSVVAGLPLDDEVVYGKDEHDQGLLLHVSELAAGEN